MDPGPCGNGAGNCDSERQVFFYEFVFCLGALPMRPSSPRLDR